MLVQLFDSVILYAIYKLDIKKWKKILNYVGKFLSRVVLIF